MLHDKKYVSLPKGSNPLTTTLDEAVAVIEQKRSQERQRHIKTFEEDPAMEVRTGRCGPYIAYNGNNYHMPKSAADHIDQLTYAECKQIVETAPEPRTRRRK